jgi:nicotinic acid mononucleotide adenylyltransferase
MNPNPRSGLPAASSPAKVIRRIRRGVDQTFGKLERWRWLKPTDLKDFRHYHRLMDESLLEIEAKIGSGALSPLDLKGFPQVASFPRYHLRAGLFIGSFDPFQMTHLTMALHFLASRQSQADVVFVVPEGAPTSRKPNRSDYAFLFEVLEAQVADIFDPLVVPLDIGRNADTIEIVQRFISLFPGSTLTLTHLMGTDSLPFVQQYGLHDRRVWNRKAREQDVKLDYRIFAIPRGGDGDSSDSTVAALKAKGLLLTVDKHPVCAPSSTDLRRKAIFTILFPASRVLRRVEILFRYSMNKSWTDTSLPEYVI